MQRRERLLNHHVTLEPEYSPYVRDAYKTSVEVMKVLLRRGHAGRRWSLADVRRRGLDEMIQLLTPKEILPHSLYMWARRARAALPRRAGEDSRVAVYFCEQPPRPESRVTLSNERDALGVNRLILDWRIPDEVVGSMLRLQELLRIGLERRGIGELVPGEGAPRFTDASHHMGTTRMSDELEAWAWWTATARSTGSPISTSQAARYSPAPVTPIRPSPSSRWRSVLPSTCAPGRSDPADNIFVRHVAKVAPKALFR